jgi:hypothetical protein
MFKHHSTQRAFAAAVLILGSTTMLSAYADGAAGTAPRPGSRDALILAKDPMFFKRGTETKPASGAASFAAFESVQASRPAPRPGSRDALILAKDPMFFKRGTETKSASGSASFAAFESVQASRSAPRPGSRDALILAKDPMFFKRGTHN